MVGDVRSRCSGVQNGVSNLQRASGRNASGAVAANRAVHDGTAALDTAGGQVGIVAAKGAVSEGYATGDPAAAAPWLAIVLTISSVATDCATDDRHPATTGYAAAGDIGLVTADGAVGNRQRAIANDAAATSCWEWVGYTSPVVGHQAIGDRQRSAVVVNATAIAATERVTAVCRDVAVDRAVDQRRCRVTAIGGIVVNASTSIVSIISADSAVEDRQCRGAC